MNKYFKQLNIKPLYKMNIKEQCLFAIEVASIFTESYPEYGLDYLKIVEQLQHINIYISDIPKDISPVNYSYTDNSMYISESLKVNANNEFILHEVIHRMQEIKNKKNQLVKLGLCNILETKIEGLALNEAAIQYIVKKMQKSEKETVKIYGMNISTISKNYYPIITNLIEKMSFLIGEGVLIDSTINSNEEFKYKAIDCVGENNFFEIQANFDKILESKNEILKKSKDDKSIIDNIKNIYIETEKKIITGYFDNALKLIENEEELNQYSEKLLKYREYIDLEEIQKMYAEYYDSKQDDIKNLKSKFQNKYLIVANENRVMQIFRNIKKYIKKALGYDMA